MLIRKVPGSVGVRPARSFVAASTQYLTANTGLGLGANDGFYILALARRDSAATTLSLVSVGRNGTNDDSRRLHTGAETTAAATSRTTTDGSAISTFGSFSTTSGWVSLIAEFGGSASRRIIANGAAVSSTTARVIAAAPDQIRIGVWHDATLPYSGALLHVAIFAGTASDALIAAHKAGVHPTQLPGQLLECWDLDRVGPIVGLVRGTVLAPTNGGSLTPGPLVQGPPVARRFYVKGGATNYTLGATAGTVTATAPTATVTRTRKVLADAASLVTSAPSAALNYVRALVALAASYALSGTNAVATLWRKLFGTEQTVAATAPTAAGTVHRVIQATPATVDVTAPTATLTYSGASPPVRKTFMLMGVQK